MTDLQFAEEILDQLQERNPRFHPKSYFLVLAALHSVSESLDEPRHISGRELATLFTGTRGPGQYSAVWDGTDAAGKHVASGTYFYRLTVDNKTIATKSMILLK